MGPATKKPIRAEPVAQDGLLMTAGRK